MNTDRLLGSLLRSGMSRSTTSRITRGLGGRSALDELAGLAGGTARRPAGSAMGGLLAQAERAVGGRQNLAIGGLGALAGAMLAGGRRTARGAIGGGAMALLGVMAYQALKERSGRTAGVPLGLAVPQGPSQEEQLERNARLVVRAMVNAAKADGEIDVDEMGRILARVDEDGTDQEARKFLEAEMQKPMETAALVAAARSDPELAAQMYSASLLAIEVDTPAERQYLRGFGAEIGLDPETIRRLDEMVGLEQG